jgi:hypothetical protein
MVPDAALEGTTGPVELNAISLKDDHRTVILPDGDLNPHFSKWGGKKNPKLFL